MMCPIEQYRPDGWLGMLIGTRMWYPLYGEAESDASVFEERMVALCRDLGERGQRKLRVHGCGSGSTVAESVAGCQDVGAAVGDGADDDPALTALVSELRGLRTGQLRKRAAATGVSAEALEEAEEADDVKGALTALVVAKHRELGASGRMVATVEGGGEDALELVESVVEHGIDVLESVSSLSARKDRKGLRALVERAESVLEGTVDALWSQCGREHVEALGSALAAVEALTASKGPDTANVVMASVSELLDCLGRCGSAAVGDGAGGAVAKAAGGEAGSAPGSSEHSAGAKSAVLGELRELKVSELKRRAMACGVSEEEIEGACDEDDARAALAELIVAGEAGPGEERATLKHDLSDGTSKEQEYWKQELLLLKLSELRKRAAACGVSDEEVELACDEDDARAAMAALIMTKKAATKHHHDRLEQELVSLTFSALRKRAIKCGLSDEEVERACDEEDARTSLVALVVARCRA
eukprot:SAG11_NODE_2620_length_3168_cov_656.985663_1_plen_474_part_10